MFRKEILLIMAIFVICSCQNKKKGMSEKQQPIIMVTIEPQRYFTEAIAGDKFNVVTIVPKGSNPETYDPTPQQLVALKNSDAYLRIGYIGFEQIWMDRLLENTPHLKIFDTSKDIDLITDNSHQHAHEGHNHTCGIEPHIWNSTENARIIAHNTYKALSQIDKENESYYFNRYDSICKIIEHTDSIIRIDLSTPHAAESFIIYHPALSYFARDYGLQQYSIEHNGKEPSPAHLKELIDFCKKNDVNVIFIQPEFDKRNAELIAKEIGAEVVSINPLSYDWNKEMIMVGKALSRQNEKR